MRVAAALLRPRFRQILDIVQVFGLARVESEWRALSDAVAVSADVEQGVAATSTSGAPLTDTATSSNGASLNGASRA